MAKFFIDRPVFAWVIALFILLAGVLSIPNLPVSQYPTIAPPTVIVNAIFFMMFEVWFKVPLFKGSLEPLSFLGY